MSTINVDTFGLVTVTYPGQPNESHILQAPAGGKWTVLGNGTTGDMTATDGASGTPETWTLYDANGTAWQVTIDDGGILTVSSFDRTIVLAPVVNAPVTFNGLPAVGYQLVAYQSGTTAAATLYKNGEFVSTQGLPILLNEHGLPTDPVFLQVGAVYDFVLLPPGGGLPIKIWERVVGGIPLNVATATEWGNAILASYASATTATVPGDRRALFAPARRVKTTGDSTLYGSVAEAAYDGTQTTVTLLLDSGSLNGTLTALTPGLLAPGSQAMPARRMSGTTTLLAGPLTLAIAHGLNIVPPGIVALHLNPPPSGWLLCNGAAVSRTTYAVLFAAIGTTFGVGDGSTTFNLPTLAAVGSLNRYIWAQA